MSTPLPGFRRMNLLSPLLCRTSKNGGGGGGGGGIRSGACVRAREWNLSLPFKCAQLGDSFSSISQTCENGRTDGFAPKIAPPKHRSLSALRRGRRICLVVVSGRRFDPTRTDFNCIPCRTPLETRRPTSDPMSPRRVHILLPPTRTSLHKSAALHNSLGRTTKRSLESPPPPPIKRIYLFLSPPEYEKRTDADGN